MARLFLRIDLGTERLLGPGKVRLLEFIGERGSIAAAGRAMGMSYRRAWLLVDETNRCFREPVVRTQPGGRAGGGAELTGFGRDVIARYRAIERDAQTATAHHLAALEAASTAPPADPVAGPPRRAGDCRRGRRPAADDGGTVPPEPAERPDNLCRLSAHT